ncbi:hypothetical protein DFS34DRAFT_398197 [Phlyctochytrium arcticum]|nr:hypothetical protein DFS34DRAFT_398197 [Phlyctochytrium arcticum]
MFDLVGLTGQTSMPTVYELGNGTVRHEPRALRSLVNPVEDDFEKAQLPVKRNAIARTIVQLLTGSHVWQFVWDSCRKGAGVSARTLGSILLPLPTYNCCLRMPSRAMRTSHDQQRASDFDVETRALLQRNLGEHEFDNELWEYWSAQTFKEATMPQLDNALSIS